MIKQVSMMKRHPSLSMAVFVARYETYHARFGETLFARSRRFVRRYVQPVTNPLTGVVAEMDFDVIMEIWWEDRASYEADMGGLLKSDLLPAIRESGLNLFASQNNPAFTVIEHDSDMGTDWSALAASQ